MEVTSVYLNCCSTFFTTVPQSKHLKVPCRSSGRTSLVRVTTPVTETNFPISAVVKSLNLQKPNHTQNSSCYSKTLLESKPKPLKSKTRFTSSAEGCYRRQHWCPCWDCHLGWKSVSAPLQIACKHSSDRARIFTEPKFPFRRRKVRKCIKPKWDWLETKKGVLWMTSNIPRKWLSGGRHWSGWRARNRRTSWSIPSLSWPRSRIRRRVRESLDGVWSWRHTPSSAAQLQRQREKEREYLLRNSKKMFSTRTAFSSTKNPPKASIFLNWGC